MIAKNEGFGHVIEFAWFDMSDIAYSGRWKRHFCTNNNQGAKSCHNSCIICMIMTEIERKSAKIMVFGLLLSLGGQFLKFCASDWLHIVYISITQWS